MIVTTYRLEHWAAAFVLFMASAIAWTVIGHYTEKWLAEKVDAE